MSFRYTILPILFVPILPLFACTLIAEKPDSNDITTGGAPSSSGAGGFASGAGGDAVGGGLGGSDSGGSGVGGQLGNSGGTTGSGGGGGNEVPGWSPRPTTGGPVWVRARNLCPFPLWVNSTSGPDRLSESDVQLNTGDEVTWNAPSEWPAARLTAYRDGPGAGEIEKAEMTITGGNLNYNVTYVDWVGLPLEVVGVGGGCNYDAHATGCYQPLNALMQGCPEPLLAPDGRCLSPRSYCADGAKQDEEICKHLDSAIAACTSCPDASTPQVYACNGPYQEQTRLCAALNRGMTSNPDLDDPSAYYQDPPYNEYAKWSHDNCPGIYAFSYDDWNAQGGFRACQGDELRVTFCPGG